MLNPNHGNCFAKIGHRLSRSGRSSKVDAPAHFRPEVVAAYDAPFPEERFKAGARQFPILVPIAPDDPAVPANRKAWEVLRRWEKPFLTAFSDGDPVTKGGELLLQSAIRSCNQLNEIKGSSRSRR